jgi:hypothetical protein
MLDHTRTDWLSYKQACEILLCSEETIRRIIADRLVTTRKIPGRTVTRLLATDVHRLADQAIIPALAQVP